MKKTDDFGFVNIRVPLSNEKSNYLPSFYPYSGD